MVLIPVPAFEDNYIWLLHDGRRALVVDPGQAEGVLAYLKTHALQLDSILLTHHHGDHTGGVQTLREHTGASVLGPMREQLPEPVHRVAGGDAPELLGHRFEVLDVPGHTAGHVAFFAPQVDGLPLLFCGDTLFSGGCGRLFEGTPDQMANSLDRLAALPDNTRVCCAHEYTLSNLRFAQAIEPDNAALVAYQAHCQVLRASELPTLPSSIGLEKQINPFMRCRIPDVVQAAQSHAQGSSSDPLSVFTTLREWKNQFR